ncbi:MAG TPA: hypothetical protein GX526_01775, partial [Thermoanaerobacterales bacterium]|nr:hypothetical protein [Thermoanaerobacterales bacterium]
LFVICLLTILVISIGYRGIGNNKKIYTAEYGLLKPSIEGHGIIIRNEKVVKSPITGNITYIIPENTRVRKGEIVAEIIDASIDVTSIEKRLKQIEKEIEELENNYESKQVTLNKYTGIERDSKLKDKKEQIINAISDGDLSGPINYKDELSDYLEGKDNVDRDFYEPLADLKKERQTLIREIDMAAVKLTAPISGILSYKLDNFEEIFNTTNFEELSKLDIKDSNYGIINYKTPQKKIDEPAFKIVDNFEWYMIAEIDMSTAISGDIEGKSTWIKMPSNERVKGKIIELLGDNKILIKGDEHFEDLIFARKVPIKIEKESEFGIIIPVNAVILEDGRTGVVIKEARGKKFREIEILCENEDQAVVTGLKRWEKIIN